MDFERISCELMAALRGGKRSRPGFSRYLGYRSNVAQRWETGACWPTAARFFAICTRVKIQVDRSIAEFLRRDPPWLGAVSLSEADGVAALLRELRGRARLGEVASRAGINRFSVSRWLKGTAVPKLPEFLAMIEACSGRTLDFVASFVDPRALPSLASSWEKFVLSRELAYTHPSTHVLLRALELDEYRGRNGARARQLARKTGLPLDEVKRMLSLLAESGQVRSTRGGWEVRPVPVVDTGADPQRARGLKLSWARAALLRLEAGEPGYAGYSVFAISREDLRRLREAHLAFVREMHGIISASTKSECVGLYCAQLLDLAVAADNTFLESKSR